MVTIPSSVQGYHNRNQILVENARNNLNYDMISRFITVRLYKNVFVSSVDRGKDW